MQILAHKIKKLAIGWNERPFDEADFIAICRKFSITVTEMPLTMGGFYYRVRGRDFIALDSRLRGPKRLFVMFHELGHFLLHVPDSGATANFHGVGRRTRKEKEADLFALCALMPKRLLIERTLEELIDDGFDRIMVNDRMTIFREKKL